MSLADRLGGKSQEQLRKESEERQNKRALHQQNLSTPPSDDQEAAEVLRYLSEIDDLPIGSDDEVMGQLVSQLVSTTNLSAEDIEAHEWIREYLLLLYLSARPRPEGVHGAWRGMVSGDPGDERAPLDPETRTQIEAFVSTSKLALYRSEEAKVIEEANRTISESVVNEGDGDDRGRIREALT